MPVKASEVAGLADLIFQMAEGRPVNDDLRARIAGRLPSLGLQALIPFAGSLARNPLYASAYYIAVDSTVEGSGPIPFLLHMTLASAPSNPIYPRAMLIGRLRPGGGREIVVDAVPFGCTDTETVRLFVEKIDGAFLSRPSGIQSAIAASAANPSRELPVVFEAFGRIRRSIGVNLASFCWFDQATVACAWAAVRAGWRHGYSLESPLLRLNSEIPAGCSTFRVDVTEAEPDALLGFASKALRVRRMADIELVWRHPLEVVELAARLQAFKEAGVSPQFVSVPDAVENAAAIAPVIRAAGATLSFSGDGLTPEMARAVGSAAGRFRCRLETPASSADEIATLAQHLRA